MAKQFMANSTAMLKSLVDNDVYIFTDTGAPSNGTSGTLATSAGPGSLYINYSTGIVYINQNTKASPTWVAVGTTLPGSITLATGSVLVGTAGVAAALNAKTSGQILIGNGTTVVSVAITGDVTITSGGVTAIGTGKVTAAMLAAGVVDGTTLDLAGAGSTLEIKAGGVGTTQLANLGVTAAKIANATITTSQIAATTIADSNMAANTLTTASVATNVLQVASGTISSANITGTGAGQFGHAQGVVLVASPGAGKLLILDSFYMAYTFSTAAYTAGGNITVNIGGGGAALTGLISAANSVGAASSKLTIFNLLSAAATVATSNTGLNLVSSAAFTQPGTAAGTIAWQIQYYVVNPGF